MTGIWKTDQTDICTPMLFHFIASANGYTHTPAMHNAFYQPWPISLLSRTKFANPVKS